MKKFILKIFIVSVIILVIFSLMNVLFINSKYFSAIFIDWKRYQYAPNNLEIVNTGNSHGAYAFDYTDYENCFNFANDGQSLKYDLQVLKQYKDHLKKDTLVIIPVCYLSFGKIDKAKQEKHDMRYYRIIKPRFIIDFSVSDYVMYKIFPLLTVDNEIAEAIKKELSGDVNIEKTFDDFTIDEITQSQQGYKSFLIDDYSFDQEQLTALCNIIEFVKSNNMTPILTTVPVTDIFTDMCTDEIMSDFNNGINYVKDKYNVEYIDYSSHPEFCTSYEMFNDSSHMSSEGGEKFTLDILTQLTGN